MNYEIEEFTKQISEFLNQYFRGDNFEFDVRHYADIQNMQRIISIRATMHNEYNGTKFNEQFTLTYSLDERYFGNSLWRVDRESFWQRIVAQSIRQIQEQIEKSKYFQYRKKMERIQGDFI